MVAATLIAAGVAAAAPDTIAYAYDSPVATTTVYSNSRVGALRGDDAAPGVSRMPTREWGALLATKAPNVVADRVAQVSGLVGNRRMGSMARAEADDIGRAWVGPNARTITERASGSPVGLIDPTKRFVYRFPQFKHSGRARGSTQANLERFARPGDKNPELNVHITITR